jgi:predicted double-glycine peptidase
VGLLIKTSQDGKFLLNKAVVNGQGKIPDFSGLWNQLLWQVLIHRCCFVNKNLHKKQK